MEPVEIFSGLLSLWLLGAAVVICGGVLPTEWQTLKGITLVGLVGLPLAILGIAAMVAYPALMFLVIIVALAGSGAIRNKR